jgi:PBP1b-binding outer membrane lipoprotein LpoB
MKRTAIALSVLALAGLVGCKSDPAKPGSSAKAAAPTTATLPPVAARTGFGRVESIAPAPTSSAAAGGATLRRLGIKMEDGTMQMVDTAGGDIKIGDRVELTSDGKIRN